MIQNFRKIIVSLFFLGLLLPGITAESQEYLPDVNIQLNESGETESDKSKTERAIKYVSEKYDITSNQLALSDYFTEDDIATGEKATAVTLLGTDNQHYNDIFKVVVDADGNVLERKEYLENRKKNFQKKYGNIELVIDDDVQMVIPINNIKELAEIPGVSFVRLPIYGYPETN